MFATIHREQLSAPTITLPHIRARGEHLLPTGCIFIIVAEFRVHLKFADITVLVNWWWTVTKFTLPGIGHSSHQSVCGVNWTLFSEKTFDWKQGWGVRWWWEPEYHPTGPRLAPTVIRALRSRVWLNPRIASQISDPVYLDRETHSHQAIFSSWFTTSDTNLPWKWQTSHIW